MIPLPRINDFRSSLSGREICSPDLGHLASRLEVELFDVDARGRTSAATSDSLSAARCDQTFLTVGWRQDEHWRTGANQRVAEFLAERLLENV